jgi:pyruvate/2-oxoglutarate dehydrogenase complex dihydrolipoamide acyltransferase (E2) component
MTHTSLIDVKLPQFGMGMTEGTIVEWHKAVGDAVSEGEPLADVEAAKATSEIVAPASGRLAEIVVALDETVPVHSVIARIAS